MTLARQHTQAQPAADITEEERFQTGGVTAISLGHAVHDTYTAFLPPLLPVFIENLSLSTTQAGGLTVFTQLPSLLQPVIGHLADRASLRWMVILAPGLSAALMSSLGLAPGYLVLALMLTFVGLSSAGFHAIGPVTIGQLSGRFLGRGMSFWMVGGELGRTVGPLLVVTALGVVPLANIPLLMVFGWLTSLALYFRLKHIPEHFAQSQNAAERDPWWRTLRGMTPFLAPLAVIVLSRTFLISALTTYLPTFLTQEGATLWLAGASLSVLEAAGVVGAMLGGSLSDSLGRRRMLAVSMLSTGGLMFAFLTFGGAARLPLLILLGFAALSITPILMALVQESAPENRAFANGLYMALNFASRAGAVLVLGMISDGVGMHTAFLLAGVVSLVGVPFIALLPKRQAASG